MTSSFVLITQSNPQYRILLHRDPTGPRVTVETAETDAVGAPQWAPEADSRANALMPMVALALIDHAVPGARAAALAGPPVLLGVVQLAGAARRFVLECQSPLREGAEPSLRLVEEHLGEDCAGAPRWVRRESNYLTLGGVPHQRKLDVEYLLGALFPAPPPSA